MTMNAFNKEYYLVLLSKGDDIPSLTPDDDTSAKPFTYKALPVGGKPLIFYNGMLDWQQERGIVPMYPPPDVMFGGSDVLVCDRIAKELDDLELPNLAIQPAIYIDHKDAWHENYWFLTFTAKFDCWDRKQSEYDPEPAYTDPIAYEVYHYLSHPGRFDTIFTLAAVFCA
jgi:hypothetical protein